MIFKPVFSSEVCCNQSLMIVLVIFKKCYPPRKGVSRFLATTTRTFHCQLSLQKQPFKGVLRKRCSENMQEIYRRATMPKCDFNKVVLLREFHEIFHNSFLAEHLQAAASASINS